MKYISVLLLALFLMVPSVSQSYASQVPAQKQAVNLIQTTPLEIVSNPTKFLNKKVVMTAKFDKFSTLGLDYKKALRDSAKYVGFLVQRDDVVDHNIPLSELKIFVKREYAEKFIDLNTGDKLKITGFVFSNALGDGWFEAEKIDILEKVPTDKK